MEGFQEYLLELIEDEKRNIKFGDRIIGKKRNEYADLKKLCEMENGVLGIKEEILTYSSCICKENSFMGEPDIREGLDMSDFTYGYHDDLEDDVYLFIYIFCTRSRYEQLDNIAKKTNNKLVLELKYGN